MTQDSPEHRSPDPVGRRAAAGGRRLEGTVVAAVLVPLLALGALLVVDDPGGTSPASAPGVPAPVGEPSVAPLTAVDLGCPAGVDASSGPLTGPDVAVAPAGGRAEDEGGARLDVVGGPSRELDLSGGPQEARAGRRPAVVRGRGAVAPGLAALRAGSGLAVSCPPPVPERWFAGAGAGATHASVLELVNPDRGPAVADVTVLGSTGVLDVPSLRGVTVPGGEALRLELAELAPRRDELALRVDVGRGRLTTTLLDRVDRLVRDGAVHDWLPPQAEPAEELFLPGLVEGSGERTLVVANPGDSEARVRVEVVTARSTIAPVGLEPEVVAPGSVAALDLGRLLAAEVRGGARALRLTASHPVLATLRQAVGDDVAHAVAAPAVTSSAVLLPPGRARLVLAGASAVGAVEVRGYTAAGRALRPLRRELDPDRALVVDLPADAVRVELDVRRATVSAAALVTAPGRTGGTVVLPLHPVLDRALVPRVAPGLP